MIRQMKTEILKLYAYSLQCSYKTRLTLKEKLHNEQRHDTYRTTKLVDTRRQQFSLRSNKTTCKFQLHLSPVVHRVCARLDTTSSLLPGVPRASTLNASSTRMCNRNHRRSTCSRHAPENHCLQTHQALRSMELVPSVR